MLRNDDIIESTPGSRISAWNYGYSHFSNGIFSDKTLLPYTERNAI